VSLVGLSAQDRVSTFAGSNLLSGTADGPRTNARFNDPAGMACAADGTIYIADSANHTIRKISTNGVVSTLAGLGGTNGAVNGTGLAARFDTPTGLALDANGNLFVADTGNHAIRKVTPTGQVTTFAGFAGENGFSNAVGTAARFNSPLGVAVGTNGLLYVADSGNHVIRAITPAGAVGTLAGEPESWGFTDGTNSTARFNNPVGLALDCAGNLFVADANNHTIRKVTPTGVVTTFAGLAGTDGFADGTGGAARFAKPAELTFDDRGNLFVADSFNHLIREITPEGRVETVAGLPRDDGANDGVNRSARFFNPYGLAVSPCGELLVADAYNAAIRSVLVPAKLAITAGGDQVLLSWNSVVGRGYQVQYCDADGKGVWSDLGPSILATGKNSMAAEAITAGRLYRVRVLD
jgi:sugar lactone lactonase YvrE